MKKFFTILMAMIFATSVFAQKPLEPSNITDNISVTVKAGVSTPLHHSFTTIDPLVGLEFNKMITPTFGLGVEGEWTIKDACNAAENIRFEHQYQFQRPNGRLRLEAKCNLLIFGQANLNCL